MPHHAPPRPAPSASTWVATGRRMTVSGSMPPAMIDLDHPRRGITVAVPGGGECSLLGLDPGAAPRLVDHWLRGDDVTAVYESEDARHVRITAMWRLVPSLDGTRAWELVASAQTSLLQSDAALPVVSHADTADILWGRWEEGTVRWQADPPEEPHCLLLQNVGAAPAAGTSVLVVPHPSDAGSIAMRRDGRRVTVECPLFATAVEKGVLLRSRVLAAIGPSADARRWAADMAAAFAATPPMLTT